MVITKMGDHLQVINCPQHLRLIYELVHYTDIVLLL